MSGKLLRRLVGRCLVFARGYVMLGFSGLALMLAAAVTLGAFGLTSQPRRARVAIPADDIAGGPAVASPYRRPLVLTYYLVDSQEEQMLLYSLEDQMVNREWLQRWKVEVLLARDASEEQAAYQEVAAAKVRSATSTVLLEDLRSK